MLVDASVWVDHLRRRNPALVEQLEHSQVSTHPFVIGELACGNLANREAVVGSLAELPQVRVASHEEVLAFVHSRRLMGRGLGWVDVHLLAAAVVAKVPFWTVDRRLLQATRELEVHFHG